MPGCSSGGCGSGGGCPSSSANSILESSGKVIWSSQPAPSAFEPVDIELNERMAQAVPVQPLRTESPEALAQLIPIFLKIEQKRIPFWTHMDLTYKCNTDCIHCYCQHLDPAFGGKHDRQDLTTQEVFNLLDQLADYGVLNLTLSGGELLVRKDFFEIATYASREKHFALTLYSNGTLINEKIADRLADLAPVAVEMSLQGSTAAIHDAIVRRPGSFDRVIHAAKLLRAHGVRITLKTTIMQPNADQLEPIYRLSNALGASSYRSTAEVTPRNDGDRGITLLQVSEEQQEAYMSTEFMGAIPYVVPIAPEEARNRFTCGTGTIGCYISPYGDVYPCIQLLISMGNIREHSFKDIWEAPSELRRKLDSIQSYGDLPDCKTCEYVQLCQRCHGLAYMETGDLTKCYKMALQIAKVRTRVNARIGEKRRIDGTNTYAPQEALSGA